MKMRYARTAESRPSRDDDDMGRKYFGTDGIRGRANGKLTAELALKVGQAAGLVFQRGEHRHRVVIGKDTRLSSYMIEYAMVARLHLGRHGRAAARPGADAGGGDADALDALRPRRDDLGLAQPLRGQRHQAVRPRRLQALRRDRGARSRTLLDADLDAATRALAAISAARARIDDVVARYIEYAKRTLPRDVSLEGLRVVVDCANGAAYKAAPEALWELGAEVIKIGVEPDGFNINRARRLDLARGARRARCARCAPTSASRSTATPTA